MSVSICHNRASKKLTCRWMFVGALFLNCPCLMGIREIGVCNLKVAIILLFVHNSIAPIRLHDLAECEACR